MLILGLDEGSIGAAGVAFSAFHLKHTVWARFDKIHRLIRDMKLAEADCCGKLFVKAKLWSNYLYGLNNRPFGSGANHPAKQRMLEVFGQSETIDSPCFQKYMAEAAKEFGMPCDTTEEQQRVFNKVCTMQSFVKKLGQPKASNWFAWNNMASQQIPKLSGSKIIFTSAVEGAKDPDEEGPFDQPCTDPRQQLSALLKQGGWHRLGT